MLQTTLNYAMVFGLMSLITFYAYACDKEAAINGSPRIRESHLLFLSLACGWPGALIAQRLLRHKTKKTIFKAKVWATVVLNIAFLTGAFSWAAKQLHQYSL